jgi:hypothetical protein
MRMEVVRLYLMGLILSMATPVFIIGKKNIYIISYI